MRAVQAYKLLTATEVPVTNQDLLDEDYVPQECPAFPERAKEYPDLEELDFPDGETEILEKKGTSEYLVSAGTNREGLVRYR